MNLLTSHTPLALWHDVIKQAEADCQVQLQQELEGYLVCLLSRYIQKPALGSQIFATSFLAALDKNPHERIYLLQDIGDSCLLFAGLFPRFSEKRRVKLRYFVDLGQSAYANISRGANDLYGELAYKFVPLMDVLQSISPYSSLLPLEAYEQWESLRSKRALHILQTFIRS